MNAWSPALIAEARLIVENITASDMKSLREALGMTQEQFAREVGVSYSTVSRWETGRGQPSPLAQRRIAELRDVAKRRSTRSHVKEEEGRE